METKTYILYFTLLYHDLIIHHVTPNYTGSLYLS